MKKKIFKLFVMSLLFTIATVVSSGIVLAQSRSLTVEIPFNFHVGNERFVAGNYKIKKLAEYAFLLRNVDGDASFLAFTPFIIGDPKKVTVERIVFNQYGKKYFLKQIFSDKTSSGRALTESSTEKRARLGLDERFETSKNVKPKEVVITIEVK